MILIWSQHPISYDLSDSYVTPSCESSKVKGALGKLRLPKRRSSKKKDKKEGQSGEEETQEKYSF